MNVAVLGAGYAGVTLARRLEDALPADVELVVVDESERHVVQHELHRVVRRPGFADEITVPLPELFDRAAVRRARVESVDPGANRVEFADGPSMTYDYAAVCLGAETAFYDLPGLREHATPLKRLEHAREIRAGFLDLPPAGRVVVGGAGLSGIQVAGELAALAREEGIDGIEITLLERLDSVAPGFRPDFQSAVREELEARGVEVRTGRNVTGATDETVELEGGSIGYDQLVWTGGIRGPAALGGDRPTVRSDLRLDGDTFVVGDAARVIDRDGDAVPASAQAAIREARAAASNLARLVEHDRTGDGGFEPRLEAFDFEPTGWIVSVGAVAQFGPAVLRGRAALALKASVGVGYLTSVGAVGEAVDLAFEEFGAID